MKFAFGLGLLLAALVPTTAHARSIDIAIRNGVSELHLINPSTIAVSYDIICHKASGSGTVVSLTGESLAVNAKKTYTVTVADSATCASSASPVSTYTSSTGAKFHLCSGTTNYAGASALCGTGNAFCFPKTTSACTDWSTFCTSPGYWLKTDTSTQFKTFCGSFGSVTAGNAIVGSFTNAAGYARKSSSDVDFQNMHMEPEGSSGFGAVCCEAPEYASYCRITISSTNPAARLISPDFRGGSAF